MIVIKHKPLFLYLLLTVLLLTSCSKFESDLNESDFMAIRPYCQVDFTTNTKASIDNTQFPENTRGVFNLMAYSGVGAPTNKYFVNEIANSLTAGKIELETPKYYPNNSEEKLYFYAYSPSNVIIDNGDSMPDVKYTITGQEDIITSQVLEGIGKSLPHEIQKQPQFIFKHKLKKVKFSVVSLIGTKILKSIKIIGVKSSATLKVKEDILVWDEKSITDFTVYENSKGIEITVLPLLLDCSVMFEPGLTFDIKVTTITNEELSTSVTLTGDGAGEEGVSHTVTISFVKLLTKSYLSESSETIAVDSYTNKRFY